MSEYTDTRFRIEPRYTSRTKPPGPPQEGWQRLGWWRAAIDHVAKAVLGGQPGTKLRGGDGAKLRARMFFLDDL
jgi:hypothetical protein